VTFTVGSSLPVILESTVIEYHYRFVASTGSGRHGDILLVCGLKIGSRGRCRCMVRSQEAVGFLMFAKAKLGDNAYKELV